MESSPDAPFAAAATMAREEETMNRLSKSSQRDPPLQGKSAQWAALEDAEENDRVRYFSLNLRTQNTLKALMNISKEYAMKNFRKCDFQKSLHLVYPYSGVLRKGMTYLSEVEEV